LSPCPAMTVARQKQMKSKGARLLMVLTLGGNFMGVRLMLRSTGDFSPQPYLDMRAHCIADREWR
jgi:hypothetical protein